MRRGYNGQQNVEMPKTFEMPMESKVRVVVRVVLRLVIRYGNLGRSRLRVEVVS